MTDRLRELVERLGRHVSVRDGRVRLGVLAWWACSPAERALLRDNAAEVAELLGVELAGDNATTDATTPPYGLQSRRSDVGEVNSHGAARPANNRGVANMSPRVKNPARGEGAGGVAGGAVERGVTTGAAVGGSVSDRGVEGRSGGVERSNAPRGRSGPPRGNSRGRENGTDRPGDLPTNGNVADKSVENVRMNLVGSVDKAGPGHSHPSTKTTYLSQPGYTSRYLRTPHARVDVESFEGCQRWSDETMANAARRDARRAFEKTFSSTWDFDLPRKRRRRR